MIKEKIRLFYYRIKQKCFEYRCRYTPIKKAKIVFSNFNGKGFGDNPKYIADEIIRQRLPYDLVWLVSDLNEIMPKGVRKVKFGGSDMKLELSTAKIIVNNVKNDLPYNKKKEQYYIQTWHGGFPLKYIEAEVEDKLTPEYVEASRRDSQKIDLLLASCSLDEEIMQNNFWYSGEIFKVGIPRNDVYFKRDSKIKKRVYEELGIPNEYHVVLYAPTFRDDNSTASYNLAAQRIIDTLQEITNDKWAIIIRLHPNVTQYSSLFTYTENILDGSFYHDPQELSFVSDFLITDYSSIMYDFSLMKKPVFIYANDLEEYKHGRGLRPIYETLPFSISHTNDDLVHAIASFDKDAYLRQTESFWTENVEIYDRGVASKAIVERIKLVVTDKFRRSVTGNNL